MTQRLIPRIHARGDAARLDAVLELVAFSARPRPITVALDELPRRIAQVFGADVCSLYLLEGEDLVMRGNVGFEPGALGEVRLAVGEGITGRAVEYMRPISLDAAPTHESYRHFPDLGEERFPIFLAVPIAGHAGPLGALVLQRRERPAFVHADIELAAALTAPVAAAVERAKLVDALHGSKRAGHLGARRVTLSGRSVVPGSALGVVYPLPRPAARAKPSPEPASDFERALTAAIGQVRRAIASFVEGPHALAEAERRLLDGLGTMLDDARLGERTLELAEQGKGLSHALTQVGAEAIRTAERAGDAFGQERARQLSDVCEALALIISGVLDSEVPRGPVLVGDQFTVADLLLSLRVQPSAVVLAEHASTSGARALLSLAAVPAVVEVGSLFRWVTEGELALVDGDHGLVRLNPSRSEVATFRSRKKQADKPGG